MNHDFTSVPPVFTLTVLLFAALRDLAKTESVRLVLPPGATVSELRRAIATLYPEMANLLARSVFAVNHEFVLDAHVLFPNDEVAVIPPVSGG